MGGPGLGDRQDRPISGQCKVREIKKMHAIGVSPREGTSTAGKAAVSGQDPSAIMEKMRTLARYMAIAAPDRIECVPTSERWIPSFFSPIVTMPSLRRFATISDVMLMVLFLCCARETGEF